MHAEPGPNTRVGECHERKSRRSTMHHNQALMQALTAPHQQQCECLHTQRLKLGLGSAMGATLADQLCTQLTWTLEELSARTPHLRRMKNTSSTNEEVREPCSTCASCGAKAWPQHTRACGILGLLHKTWTCAWTWKVVCTLQKLARAQAQKKAAAAAAHLIDADGHGCALLHVGLLQRHVVPQQLTHLPAVGQAVEGIGSCRQYSTEGRRSSVCKADNIQGAVAVACVLTHPHTSMRTTAPTRLCCYSSWPSLKPKCASACKL